MRLQKMKKEETQIKWIFWMVLALFIMVLVPLFRVGYYNFKSVDDFSYAQAAEKVWEESGSVWKVLLAQISYTWNYYLQWQGTFFSEWLTTSVMGIFSKNAYYMSTWLTLGGFVAAEALLLMTVFKKVLGADIWRSGIVTMSCIILQVLLVPYPSEAFYWFCGSMLYTFIHALGMLLCTLWICLYFAGGGKNLRSKLSAAAILVLSVAVAGSNYITALTILLLYLLCCGWFLWKKHPWRKWMILCNILYLAAFLVNVMAPGNLVRQDASGVTQMNAVKSILLAVKEAADYLVTWSILPCVITGILLLPLFWNMVGKKGFRYPWPVLISLLSFGIYAAQFTPTLYALGIIGAGRVQNLYRLNLFLLIYGNEIYWVGWCHRRYAGLQADKGRTSFLLPGWCIGLLILVYGLSVWGGSTLTSVSAWQSLVRGEARQYYEENKERLEILQDDTIEDVELEPFSMKPYVLFFGDIVEDPEDWVNQHMANYYGKKSVRLKKGN